jgi:hypothetical protein
MKLSFVCGCGDAGHTLKSVAETRSGEQYFMYNMCRYEWGI